MAYLIRHLDSPKLTNKLYLFDANLWIKILKPAFRPSGKDEKYCKFFKDFTTHVANPKIALPALVLSEIINRIMREVAMAKYIRENNIDKENISKSFYKEIYRPTPHFAKQYAMLCDDIRAYHNSYELINDELGKTIKTSHVISPTLGGLDFNDHYYYQLAKKKGYSIVTDDKDFFVEDVEILTYNDTLYQKYKDTIKPIGDLTN